MRGQVDIDLAIAAFADRQHGVVARWQLVARGASPDAIDRRLGSRRLRALHRGVYAAGHAALRPEGFWIAAVLALGPAAAYLSHASAAALWGLRPPGGRRIDVTVRSGAGRRRPGLCVRRHAALAPGETAIRSAIPVTSPARTLLDVAATQPRRAVERALDQAEVLRIFDLADLQRVVAAHRGRPGAPLLAALLADGAAGSTLTRSDLEDAFLTLCDVAGLARPRVNERVVGLEVDFHWPLSRLAVEVDGFAFHRTRRAFERDRERDALLAAAGWVTQRFTHRQVIDRPDEVIRALRRSLSS